MTAPGPAPAQDHALPRPRRRWLAPVALGAVILLSGIAIGAGGALYVAHELIVGALESPEATAEFIAKRMDRRLALTPEQAEAARGILQRRAAALQALRESIRPSFDAELDGMQAEVSAILTPEQAAKWNARIDTIRSRWQFPPPLRKE